MVDKFVCWLDIGFEMVDIVLDRRVVDRDLQMVGQLDIDLDRDLKVQKL